jgi:hypothetical protein
LKIQPLHTTGYTMHVIPDNQYIKVDNNTISFTIQKGPVKEYNENGCRIDDVLIWVKDTLKHFNMVLPSRETSLCITKIEEALHWLEHRTKDRTNRGVEGYTKP